MKLKSVTLVCAFAVAAAACSSTKNENPQAKPITTNRSDNTMTITAKSSMDAESLALAGEQLVAPHTFMLADPVFEMALAKDPNNKRAQFYRAFIKPFMVLKGIGKRILPVVKQYGDIVKYNQMESTFPNSPLRDFLFNGSEDIKTVTGVQDVLVQYRDAFIEFRDFLKANPDLELTINLNPLLFYGQMAKDASSDCVVVESSDKNYKVVCNYRDIAQRKINAADVVALSQATAGEILYLTLYTTYTVEGVADLAKEDTRGQMSAEERQAFLESNAGYGKLRRDHRLDIVTNLGADTVAAWKWALQNQNLLCPSVNYPFEKRRKGYLFDEGFCAHQVDSENQKTIALLESALSGVITTEVQLPNGVKRHFVVDVLAPVRNPVQDLRSVAPASYDVCGDAASLRDKTLGGLFPRSDAELLLTRRCLR